VDIQTPSGGVILGRVAIRDTGAGPFLYFTTSNGRVGRIPVSGDSSIAAGAWLSEPLLLATDVAVTPAVTNDGLVYAAMADGATSAALYRLDAATGGDVVSQAIAATHVLSSPSVVDNNIYVGTDAGTYRILDTGSGFVVSTSAGGATSGSPFVHLNSPNGAAVYAVDNSGVVQARNATNFNPIAAFDGDGEAALGAAVQSSLFAMNNVLYVGGADNQVYAVNEADGSGAGPAGSYVFFNAGAGGAITGGVAVSPGGPSLNAADPGGLAVIFGSTNGRYYQVRASDPTVYRVWDAGVGTAAAGVFPDPSPINTAPSVDRATSTPGGTVATEFVGSDEGRLHRIPRF
jgi:hypothetical protein